jgi:hypothetical protein
MNGVKPNVLDCLLDAHDMIPRTLVKLNMRNGAKFRGIIRSPQNIFHSMRPTEGNRRSRVSANKTIRATQAPTSSCETVSQMLKV